MFKVCSLIKGYWVLWVLVRGLNLRIMGIGFRNSTCELGPPDVDTPLNLEH